VKAVVVGAGLAGLSAAVRLADLGLEVTVIESGPEPGGRVRRMRAPSGHGQVDRGQHLMLGCYRETLAFAGRLGTAALVRRVTGTTPFLSGPGKVHPYRLGPLPAPFHALSAMGGLTQLGWLERVGLIRALVAAKVDLGHAPERLDRANAREWLSRHGQGANAIDSFWEPIILATLNVPPEEASAFLLAAVLVRAFGGKRADSESILPATTLHDLLVAPAVEAVEVAHGRVACRHEAVRLATQGRDRISGVVCRSGEVFEADAFVLAVPPWRLGSLVAGLGGLERTAQDAQSLGASPIVGVELWFDRPWMPYPYAGLLGSPVQWVFAHDHETGDGGARVSAVMSSARSWEHRPRREIAAESEAELRRYFPESQGARLLDTKVVKAPRATLRGRPGQRALRSGPRTAFTNLYLAGDWTATDLPATIEGAVLSGRLAAEAIRR
jgi:squalene-associated FAD-dependent desaturase